MCVHHRARILVRARDQLYEHVSGVRDRSPFMNKEAGEARDYIHSNVGP